MNDCATTANDEIRKLACSMQSFKDRLHTIKLIINAPGIY